MEGVEWPSLKRFGVLFCSNLTMLKNIILFLFEVAREVGTNCCAGQRQMLERFLLCHVQTSSFTSWRSQVMSYHGTPAVCLARAFLKREGEHRAFHAPMSWIRELLQRFWDDLRDLSSSHILRIIHNWIWFPWSLMRPWIKNMRYFLSTEIPLVSMCFRISFFHEFPTKLLWRLSRLGASWDLCSALCGMKWKAEELNERQRNEQCDCSLGPGLEKQSRI